MSEQLAIVAGGGIGGLTSALSLAAKGVNVRVLEQAPFLEETGAGIQLSPNCSRVLHALGLGDALGDAGYLPQATQFRDWRSGRLISESPLGETATKVYGAPYYHIHRGDLLGILADAAKDAANIEVQTGCRVKNVQQDLKGVSVETETVSFSGDFLVGADGIHSVVRELLFGSEVPHFTGNIAWRALVPADELPGGMIQPVSTVWWGPRRHFVHYFLRGGELVNCVCVVEKSGWEIESWTEKGHVDELRDDFSGWHEHIQTLIEHMDAHSLYKWALFDRDPLPRWGDGRVTLLGDACHPTLPFMAQGAAMAVEDAAVLANCIENQVDIPSALSRYESLRRDRTAGIQRGSRRNATVFHLSGIKAFLRNRAVRAAGTRTMDRLYAYNALDTGSRV